MSQQLSEPSVRENLSQIQELLGKITPEKWAWGQSMTDTREENIAWFTTALDTHNEGGGKLQLVITENEEKTICIVGNGPAGEANAQFIASAPAIVRFLLSLVEQEEALIKRAVELEREECRQVALKIKMMHENKALYVAALSADQVALQIEARGDE